MAETVEAVTLVVNMPVIQKEIVEHGGTQKYPLVDRMREVPAPFITEICDVQRMVIGRDVAMLYVILHGKHFFIGQKVT